MNIKYLKNSSCLFYFTALILFFFSSGIKSQSFKEMVIDSTDGSLDVSEFLNSNTGFLPVPIIITEPAVGFGGGLVLAYFHKDWSKKGNEKGLSPTISFAAGAYTSNDTWMTLIGHQGSYLKDRIRYLGALGYTSVNLTFYGGLDIINDGKFDFNMEGFVLFQELLYRINKKTPFFVGLNYMYFKKTIAFNTGIPIPGLEEISGESIMGGLNSVFLFDKRNNSLTPTKGIYSILQVGRFGDNFGGDNDYWNFDTRTYLYKPIIENKLFSGYRLDLNIKNGDVPFVELPFISLRGIPAMRYQNEVVLTAETEWRWNFYKRWSLLGFVGAGQAMEDFSDLANDIKVAGGGGFRYFLAKQYGLHAGIDIARGPEIWAWNITVGSYWGR